VNWGSTGPDWVWQGVCKVHISLRGTGPMSLPAWTSGSAEPEVQEPIHTTHAYFNSLLRSHLPPSCWPKQVQAQRLGAGKFTSLMGVVEGRKVLEK
jgi:hypothetical protein